MQTLLQSIALRVHILSNQIHGNFLRFLEPFEVTLLMSLLNWRFPLCQFLRLSVPWQFDTSRLLIFKQKVVDNFVARAFRCYHDLVNISYGLVYICIFVV